MPGALRNTVRDLLPRRDWLYLFALLAPLVVYNLSLKVASVWLEGEAEGVRQVLGVVRSDLLFNAGYVVLWIGLFALARRGMARVVVLVLFHALSLLVVVVATVAYQYLRQTGSTLDWGVIVFYVATLGEIKDVILGSTPVYAWAMLAAALAYVVLGPRLLTRAFARERGPSDRTSGGANSVPRLAATGLALISVGLLSLSVVPGTADARKSFSLSPPVNVLVTGVTGPEVETAGDGLPGSLAGNDLGDARLEETPETEKRNVVLISLESTRARSVTPYNPDLQTTPFLNELSKKSLFVERAYSTFPHTSKALTSAVCGIYPDPLTEIHEAEPGAIKARCLPELLEERGYDTAYFQSATETFENRPVLIENFGFGYFRALEDMDKKGFQRAGYLGYEDDIMLEPSRRWLEKSGKDGPFMAMYDTITPHHEYLAPTRYGRKSFAKDDILNRYLNSVRYVDFFVKNLMDQYKKLGLYDNTIFVIMGDHGEAFGEHDVKGHDGVPYEEGLRIPLMIFDPQRPAGERVGTETPVNQLDIPPTILDMLGFRVTNGSYQGRSLLESLPEDRTMFSNCRPDPLCTTSIKGDEKYIYNYGRQPDEFYDLSKDPLEKNNLIENVSREEIDRRRAEVLRWRSQATAVFDGPSSPTK